MNVFSEIFGAKGSKPYICNVIFFIVLDLRLTKGWSKALLHFFARTFRTR
jgi:hypothetical protein